MSKFWITALTLIVFLPFTAEAGMKKKHYHKEKKEGYFDQYLPKWAELDLELRHRIEVRDNFDFNDAVDDEDAFHLLRTRVGLTLKPTEQIKLYGLFQDSRIYDDEFSSKSSYENWHDIKKLYLQITDPVPSDYLPFEKVKLQVGRIPLKYGKERLIGDPDWDNVGQSFDAGKVSIYLSENSQIDFFGGKLKKKKTPREFDDLFEGETKDNVFGIYSTFKPTDVQQLEAYVIRRKNNKGVTFGNEGKAEPDSYTVGGRIEGHIADTAWDYEVEAAYQFGDFDEKDISAWMFVGGLGYTLKDIEFKPRFGFEYAYASGDGDSTDDELNTFDNLWPTNHKHYGYSDRIALQNIHAYKFDVSAKPMKNLKLKLAYHLFFLDEETDSLYAANRSAIRTSTTADDSYVGSEIDLTAKYKLNQYAAFLFGYSHFFAGDYLDDTGNADDSDYFYAQTKLTF